MRDAIAAAHRRIVGAGALHRSNSHEKAPIKNGPRSRREDFGADSKTNNTNNTVMPKQHSLIPVAAQAADLAPGTAEFKFHNRSIHISTE